MTDQFIRGAGGKSGGGGTEDPNTLRSRATARVIDVLCEGPIKGLVNGAQSIFFGETPVQDSDGSFNFPNFSYQERIGTPTQTPVNGFNTVETGVSVGVEVSNGSPVERSFSNQDLSGVRVILQWPGLSKVTDDGDIIANSVELKIEVKNSTSAYATVVQQVVEGKTVSPYERGYRVNFTGTGPWSVRVSRITPNPTEVKDVNKFTWTAAFELIDAKMIYPDTAYVALAIDAESTGGSVPVRGYEIEGLNNVRFPSNYNPVTRAYSGTTWNGTFSQGYTNNPAWVMYEVLTNKRWGLGRYIDDSQINKYALYEIGKYCDQLVDDGFGGKEPRYTFNGVINSPVAAYEAVQAIASNFRSMSFWGSGAITFSQDAPRDPVQLVSPANVIDGNFDYSSSGLKDRFTVAHVTWNDPKDFYRQAVEVYEDAEGIRKYGWRKTELLAVGCTSRGQARRMGKWAIKTALNEREFIQYKASYDHVRCRPGDIITVADPTIAGIRLAGRVKARTVNLASHTIVLDSEVQLYGGDSITLVAADGTLQTRTLINEASSTDTVETSSKFTFTPRVGTMFLIGSGTVQPRKWRVLTVREEEPNIYEITGIEYNDEKFGVVEQDLFFTDSNFSVIPSGKPRPPTDAQFVETLYRANNTVRSRLTLSWKPPTNPEAPDTLDPRVSAYFVQHRGPSGGSFNPLGRFEGAGVDLDNAEVGTNTFRVYSETANGVRSTTPLEITIQAVGKSAPPADVTGLVASPELQSVLLVWNAVSDIDLIGYDVREGPTWQNSVPVSTRMKGTQIVIPLNDTLPHTFLVRALDDTGNYSVNTASVVAQVSAPASVTYIEARQDGERVQLLWSSVPGIDVEYEIRAGLSWDLGQRLARVSGTSTSFLYPANREAIFWIKSVSKLGLYSETPRFARVDLLNPPYRNVVYTNNIQDTGFPGTKWDMAVNTTTDTLVVNQPSTAIDLYGDYFQAISLPADLRARNWIDQNTTLVDKTSITWAEATFAWNSEQAVSLLWSGDAGEDSGAEFEALISQFSGFNVLQDVEAWSLSNTAGLTGQIAATAPLVQVGLTHSTLRETSGVVIDALTDQLSYAITARTAFTVLFRVRFATPNGDSGWTLLELANSTGTNWIKVRKLTGGSLAACTFRCEDHLGRVQDVTIPVGSVRDFFDIGIAQDANVRRFIVSSWRTGQTGFHELVGSAITTLDRLHFYDA